MKQIRYFEYTFSDGYVCIYAGKMDKVEILASERKHGKVVKIIQLR